MDKQRILQADYLDILFDNRNKQYGGYELRKHYGHRYNISMLLLLSVCTALVLWGWHRNKEVFSAASSTVCPITPPEERVVELTKIIPTEIPQAVPAQQDIIEPPAPRPTEQFTPPTIVHDEEPLTSPPTQEDLATSEPGPSTNEGNPDGVVVSNDNSGTGIVAPPTPPAPVKYAEVMPAFPGDIYQYLGNNTHYPAMAKENGIEGKVVVQFVVNEDGSISGTKVLRHVGGGCDDEALRVVSSMPAWKPGMQNGQPVKVYYTLPITFKLR